MTSMHPSVTVYMSC